MTAKTKRIDVARGAPMRKKRDAECYLRIAQCSTGPMVDPRGSMPVDIASKRDQIVQPPDTSITAPLM
jgi:hypothetical protein